MTQRVFMVLWLLLAALKLALAVHLPLFGDEAFYWWESRWPAWSYSDLPPLTAWLIGLGSAMPGAEIAVRWPFLLLGLLLPWQVAWLARSSHGEAAAWTAGILALVLPLAFAIGVMAVPDVVMACLSVAAAHQLLVALAPPARARPWLLLGVVLGLGMLCHYRFAALPLVIALVVLMHPHGRAALRTPWPWLAALVAASTLLPLWWFNAGHDYAGLRFQLLDRHPWAWQSDGWLQLAEQALVVGPVLAWIMVATMWRLWRRRPLAGNEMTLAVLASGMWLLFFALGFVADNERFRWHWQLPAYLVALPLVAGSWSTWSQRIRTAALAVSALVIALVLAYFAAGIWPSAQGGWFDGKRFPANFSGWREVAAWQREADAGATPVIVDNFMLGAALTYYMAPERRDAVRVLDDPLNSRHGRAAQLAIWSLDEAALASQPPAPGWLLVEETARRFSDRWGWYRSLCTRFAGLRLDGVLDLFDGRKRFVRWRHDGYSTQPHCDTAALPPLGWVDQDRQVRHRGEPVLVSGWVTQAGQGIEAVDIRIEGQAPVSVSRTREAAWARQHWGELGDPAGDRLGFGVVIDTRDWAAGTYTYQVEARRPDGLVWPIGSGALRIDR
jgi:4-amino-4-deoxy-L-arabinose transferase-like glycosyltransferase